jgi:hypothetical protein
MLILFLLIAALLLFLAAASNRIASSINLTALGLAALTLAYLLRTT